MQTWTEALKNIKQSDSFKSVNQFVMSERKEGKTIFPPAHEVFNAFKYTDFNEVKVVILGQDPYHNDNQANGLAFSVRPEIKMPPSLVNIYKEIADDIGVIPPQSGDLTHWAKQGVLLLNTVLTVQAHQANSHRGKGWEVFTDEVIKSLNKAPQHIVFLLWGKPAQQKATLIDSTKHTVLTAPHPSPLSAYRGFFGCKHFSKANQCLVEHNQEPVVWV